MKAMMCVVAMTLAACASTPNRNPTGETFPKVQGTSLSGKPYELPAAFQGSPTVLLVAYDQNAQFDVDRWLLGLLQAETKVKLYEVPTVANWVAGRFGEQIDSGMRSGIPEEDWSVVVTIYDDGDKVVAWTGDTNPRNARVVLLDASGKVVWFHDRGYSARVMMELDAKVAEMSSSPPINNTESP